MPSTGEAAAVASEPRLFVGQIPIDASVDDLAQLFAPFAARGLRSLNLVKRPDGVSKGCAMVLFERWAEGEPSKVERPAQHVFRPCASTAGAL
jgi:RNA recognition motif. (a.k.a. RRM, RBD, or RNP domain)